MSAVTRENKREEKASEKRSNAAFRRKRLAAYTWRSRLTLIPGLLVETLAVAADLAAPYLVGIILNQQIAEGVGARDPLLYARLLFLYFAAICAASFFRYQSGLFLQKTANNIMRIMQLDVFSHLQKLPISYFDQLPAGKVVSRVTNDSKAVRVLFASVLVKLLTASIYGIGIYLNLLFLDRRLLLLAILPLPLLALAFRDFQSKSARYSRDYRRALSELNAKINEDIQGIDVIQTLGREKRVLGEFEEINERHYSFGIKLTRLWSYSAHNITQILQYLMLGAALAYFGFGRLGGQWVVPLGSMYIFVDYMTKFFDQVNQAMMRVGDMERAKGAADHIFELLREEPVAESDAPLAAVRGEIAFESVSFAYGEEAVLREVSFQIEAGDTVAFVGPTGSGKSTVMNLLLGFYRPQQGRILLDGQPYEDLPIQSLRRQMAIVLQDPYLFTGTLYSNISLNRPEIGEAQAEQALREVGGGPLLDRLDLGILSPVTEKGSAFSTGERQLISFARALAQNPKILVLDEATSSIDSETEALIQHGIQRLEEGRSTLLIAHRLSTVRHARQIFVLKDGRIIERGRHEELMALNGVYHKMVEEQSRGVNGK